MKSVLKAISKILLIENVQGAPMAALNAHQQMEHLKLVVQLVWQTYF